ncbi:thiolase family protein [Aeromicrobium panaciterrae]|uniref:thiolase family protein n=1 Tax=Aeromicrobium panaciterrae TaxID=363861 RepID=UPI0031D739EE
MPAAVIVDAVRSPLGKGRAATETRPGGALSGLHGVELLAQVIGQLMERSGIDPGLVEDVIVGCVSQVADQSGTPGRWAWLAAGLPEHVPSTTVDRRCGSSQQAAHFGAQAVMSGACDVVVVAGLESMSRVPMGSARLGRDPFGPSVQERYAPGLVPQGVSAELIAHRWGLGRAELDECSARSHELAAHFTASGGFDGEIVPINIPGCLTPFTEDETIRPGTTVEALESLPSSFRTDEWEQRFPDLSWHLTAGNSSQISDGASALLVMSEDLARRLGVRARARFHSFAIASDDPITMLMGPVPATEKILARSGLSIDDINHIEVNEAFASVPLAWASHFGVDRERLNPRGGAIALGHPLGASGARIMTTMLNGLEQTGGRYGLQTMCEAGGMANATIIERA